MVTGDEISLEIERIARELGPSMRRAKEEALFQCALHGHAWNNYVLPGRTVCLCCGAIKHASPAATDSA